MCGQCIQSPPEYDCLRAVFRYDWPLNHMLLRLKNQGDLACGRTLSQLWVHHAQTWKQNGATLVPVPLHSKRWTQRRFNQAEVFATALSRAFGLPVLSILQRSEHTPPQSGLDRKQRRRNLKTAFAIKPQQAIPENVVLVDDVVTTGSTIAACVHVLKKHGVKRVEVWALARTPAPA